MTSVRRLSLIDSGAEPAVLAGLASVSDSPTPQPRDGTAMESLKVAFATQDLAHVDAHFAGARNMAIYSVSSEGARFLEAVQFDEPSGEGTGGGDDRVMAKITAIKDCSVLFVAAIGGPAAARVVNNRIHPIKAKPNESITEILERLQTVLDGTPPPWLRKVLRQDEQRDMSFLDEDDD